LKPEQITKDKMATVRKLDAIARSRGQSLAQMALAWVLREPVVTSALIGASNPKQVEENVAVLEKRGFDASELAALDAVLSPAH
jgi:L-glyceraldehyde 3-phosphate reductase